MERAYQEVIEFIAGGTTPQNVVAFRPSEAAKARVESLIAQGKSGGLSEEENSELEHYISARTREHFAKARVCQNKA